jgi:hypothetical protein
MAVVLLAGGCAYRPVPGPPRATSPPSANAAPSGPPRLRLGMVTWTREDRLVYCNRRLDDAGTPVGVSGPCFSLVAGAEEPHRIVAFSNAERADTSPPDAFPSDKCRIELAAGRFAPDVAPARATLVGPSGRQLLDEWTPPPEVQADAFQIEATVSPRGTWLALVRLAIGLGEGERTVEIAGASIRKTPPCP